MNNEENMGFGSNEPQSRWIIANGGKLTVRANEGDEGAEKRVHEDDEGNKKEIWEFRHPNFTAVMTGAEFVPSNWGQVFELHLSAGGEDFTLRLKASSRLFESFAKCIPNIDKDKPLRIEAYTNKGGHTALSFKQDGKNVEWAFTKDNPNGMPAWVKAVKQGETVWNHDEADEFLYQLAKNWWGGAVPTPEQEPVPTGVASEDEPF